jgi:uncharacterized protein
MTPHRLRPHRLLFLALTLTLGGSGCFGLRPARDTTRHLLLSAPAMGVTASVAEAPTNLVVGLAPVRLPDYLETPWVAVRVNDNEIRYSPVQRWGERLDQGVRRVLGVQLGRQLAPAHVEARAWAPDQVTLELTVILQHCESALDGRVVVEGEWRIGRPSAVEARPGGAHRVELQGPPPEQDPVGAAAALSRALAEFATRIAATIPVARP